MASVQTQSTKGYPITVTYPAEKLSAHNATVRFRVGKQTVLPAYTDLNLPYLVQFQRGGEVVMFMLSDILQTSYWRRIRNAYNVLGQLDIDTHTKVAASDAQWIRRWLILQSAARGIAAEPAPFAAPAHELATNRL